MNTPINKAIIEQSVTAVLRERLNLVCQDSLTASNIFNRLVIPAKATETKNNIANN